jgi:hypothetical protein
MTVEAVTTRRRGFALGLVALVLAFVPAALFAALLSTGYSSDGTLTVLVTITLFGVPLAILLSAVLGVIAIALNAGRILAIISLVLLVPQLLFVAFAFYAIFLQNRGL